MKKLIFKKFHLDTSIFFITSMVIMSLIVWTIQAVNYLDFVTEDGHGFKVYFMYTLLNFPKILQKILPFMFFVSLFYTLIIYELKNEMNIFWFNGISKLNFVKKLISFSLLIMLLQLFLSAYLSPLSQLEARKYLKNSDISFFTSLINKGKFINIIKGLTIFIEKKNSNGLYENIFLEDLSKNSSKMIYAKSGVIIDIKKNKIFRLFKGEIINYKDNEINKFSFDEIDINLKDFSTKTIVVPKIQEIKSLSLIKCLNFKDNLNKRFDDFSCEIKLINEIKEELLKRFYQPLYIPLITLLCAFLLIFSKNNIKYKSLVKFVFFVSFIILLFSEASLRYSSILDGIYLIFFLMIPVVLFMISYLFFLKFSNHV